MQHLFIKSGVFYFYSIASVKTNKINEDISLDSFFLNLSLEVVIVIFPSKIGSHICKMSSFPT